MKPSAADRFCLLSTSIWPKLPSFPRGEAVMFRHILIAPDGSEFAMRAVSQGLALAKSLGAKVTAVTVTGMFPSGPYTPVPWPSDVERYEAAAAESARKILSLVSEEASKLGVACENTHVHDQGAHCLASNRRLEGAFHDDPA
jgi:nucleotide-binding universal stress UspA family protein